MTLESTSCDQLVSSKLAPIEETKNQEQTPLDHIQVEEVVAPVLEDNLANEVMTIKGNDAEDGEI